VIVGWWQDLVGWDEGKRQARDSVLEEWEYVEAGGSATWVIRAELGNGRGVCGHLRISPEGYEGECCHLDPCHESPHVWRQIDGDAVVVGMERRPVK
jgi:hypothetical protein